MSIVRVTPMLTNPDVPIVEVTIERIPCPGWDGRGCLVTIPADGRGLCRWCRERRDKADRSWRRRAA